MEMYRWLSYCCYVQFHADIPVVDDGLTRHGFVFGGNTDNHSANSQLPGIRLSIMAWGRMTACVITLLLHCFLGGFSHFRRRIRF